jgi:hypothetical protein
LLVVFVFKGQSDRVVARGSPSFDWSFEEVGGSSVWVLDVRAHATSLGLQYIYSSMAGDANAGGGGGGDGVWDLT